MGLTAFSILFPLCLGWLWSPRTLLKLVLMSAVFEAAAALTIGSLGVQPGLVPAFSLIGFVLLQFLLGACFREAQEVWRVANPFLAVTVWAVVSSFVMPRVFAGQVYVWPQKSEPPYVLSALQPTSGNFNQDVYLVVDCLFVFAAAAYLRTARDNSSLIRTYFWSGIVAAIVAIWQFGARTVGVPFPEQLFYCNPGLSILSDQTMGSVPRINGSFTEPSSLAGYMIGIVAASGWAMMQGHRLPLLRWAFVLGLLSIALSTSATGIASVCLMAVGVPSFVLLTGSLRLMSTIVRVWLPVCVCVLLVFGSATVFMPGLGSAASVVFSSTADKQDSESYEARSTADLDSLAAFVDSDGLGAGWGSNRSSSLIPGLLASLGIPGCVGLLWFGAVITREVRSARRLRGTVDQMLAIDSCCGGISGVLLATILSGPAINSISFYFLLALLIATATRVTGQSVLQHRVTHEGALAWREVHSSRR